ncbi:hypothetical protein M407DRAFT_23980 [Tulasnella calospora MUT 4182]|uniref:F-box domain-containing protein n=1 Tax=Tulasnella calospora MUT 4182 TaxID=1051891 RepID=A0A0C3QKA4_9AGAM|nr:hypothetical protein M407DRAFT_23980 [Tulasnella calospora MUT 4182]
MARADEAERSYPVSQGSGKSISVRTPTTKKQASIQEIPLEVMGMIFAVLDQQACAAACLVCRRWNGGALDKIWRSLPSPVPLFEILGPLVFTEKGRDLDADYVLTAQAWDRFKSYAARVRCLTYDDKQYGKDISTGLIIQTNAVHPGGIFSLTSRRYIGKSMKPGNEDLDADSVKRMLSGLSLYLANRLKFFGFGTRFTIADDAPLSTALNTFLKNQSGLLELYLPSYELQAPATISTACQASPNLRTFCGKTWDFTKETFRTTLSTLARRSASLRCVRLIRAELEPKKESIFMTDIEPMLQLSVAEDIRLWLECRLELKSTDIQQMGQAWKGLTSLALYSGEPGIPLPHLVKFAQWFPALEQLAARFDCSEYIPSADEVTSRFKTLRILTFMDGWNGQASRMAEFLVLVCGPRVVVTHKYGLSYDRFLDDTFLWETGYGDVKLWTG